MECLMCGKTWAEGGKCPACGSLGYTPEDARRVRSLLLPYRMRLVTLRSDLAGCTSPHLRQLLRAEIAGVEQEMRLRAW